MRLFFFVYIFLFLFINCSPKPIFFGVKDNNNKITFKTEYADVSCQGSHCCSESESCVRTCNNIFYTSDSITINRCYSLPQESVKKIKYLILTIRSPIVEDLERLYLKEEFRLLLNLDFLVFVDIIKQYNINEAKELLVWFAKSQKLVNELLIIPLEVRNEIIYEALASVGDRALYSSVEEGLITKISFNDSFFQYIIKERNYDLLQITHQMIKDDLCTSQFTGEGQTELCVLRVYCRERRNTDDKYAHSERLRNEIARNIKDEEYYNYIEKNVLYSVRNGFLRGKIMNNQVCQSACNDGNRGCEE